MAAILDENQVQQLLYGLAYAKTIATASKIDFRFDDFTRAYSPTAVTHGDNFTEATFRHWVKDEYKIQVGRFVKAASELSAADLLTWVGRQWGFRQKFFATYLETSSEVAVLNQKLQDHQLKLGRFAAVAGLSSGMALVALGAPVAPAVGGMLPSMVGWSAWATAGGKIAFGLGSGIAINVAGTWSNACNADVALVGKAMTSDDTGKTAKDGLKSGTPGFIDDVLAPALMAVGNKNIKDWDKQVAQAYKKWAKTNSAEAASRLSKLRNAGPAPLPAKQALASNTMKAAGYLFAGKSLYDAGSTFVKQWNGEL